MQKQSFLLLEFRRWIKKLREILNAPKKMEPSNIVTKRVHGHPFVITNILLLKKIWSWKKLEAHPSTASWVNKWCTVVFLEGLFAAKSRSSITSINPIRPKMDLVLFFYVVQSLICPKKGLEGCTDVLVKARSGPLVKAWIFVLIPSAIGWFFQKKNGNTLILLTMMKPACATFAANLTS